MQKTTGKIDAISQKEKYYGIKIGSEWFNGFGKCQYKKGDKVELGWERNEEYNNNSIKEHRLIEVAPETHEPNPAEINADKRRILDCVLEVFRKGETKTQEELIEVANNLHTAMETIYLNFAGANPALCSKVKPYVISADNIPNKEEMIKKFDEMQKEGDELKKRMGWK